MTAGPAVNRFAHNASFSDATQYAKRAKGYSVALYWYSNREMRMQAIWEHTDFIGADSTFLATRFSDMIIVRGTLY